MSDALRAAVDAAAPPERLTHPCEPVQVQARETVVPRPTAAGPGGAKVGAAGGVAALAAADGEGGGGDGGGGGGGGGGSSPAAMLDSAGWEAALTAGPALAIRSAHLAVTRRCEAAMCFLPLDSR